MRFRRQVLEPRQCRVVVMRAGVDHARHAMVVRQIGIIRPAVKGELQNFHARQIESVAQRMDFRGDETEILGHHRQRAEMRLQGFK